MPQRFVTSEDRRVFAAIGLWALVLGALLLVDTSANDEVWLADLWPVLLMLGGAATLAFAVRLASFRLRAWSNGLLVVAVTGRGFGALLGVADHTTESIARGFAELAVFTMVGFLLYAVWRSRVPVPEGMHDLTRH